MAMYSTNDLLDLCRNGIALQNEQTDLAAREMSSYIVAMYLMEHTTNLPAVLESRRELLVDAINFPEKYPRDMFEEGEEPVNDMVDSSGSMKPDDEDPTCGRPVKHHGVNADDGPDAA